MGWLWTPHTVTYQPKKDTPRGGPANDGKEDDGSSVTLSVFLEPKTSVWAEQAFGVMVQRQPYLMIGEADDLEPMQTGDLILWGGKTLKVEAKPIVYRPGDGYDSGEVILTDQTTGGRT